MWPKMYVCICKAVTDSEICRAVAHGAETVQDLTASLALGSGCGQCLDLAALVLNEQLDQQVERPEPDGAGWSEVSPALSVLGSTSF